MPTAKKLKSGSWNCQVFSHFEIVDGKKKRIYKSFTCNDKTLKGKRTCEKMAADWAANKEMEKRSANRKTVGEMVDSYIKLKEPTLAINTVRLYKSLRNKCMGKIENIYADQITNNMMQDWASEINARLSNNTVRAAYALVRRSVAEYADITIRQAVLKKERKESSVPEVGDIIMLINACKDEELRLAIELGAYSGLRRGEICALTPNDLHGNILTINKGMVMNTDGTWIIQPPKTTSSNRLVVIHKDLAKKLSQRNGEFLINSNPNQITQRFTYLANSLGLNGIHFHSLRHFFVSYNHALGIPDQYIMAMGGWSSDHVMKSVYRNTMKDELLKFSEKALDGVSAISEQCKTECKTKNKKAL